MFNFKFKNSLFASFFQVLDLYKYIKSEVSAEAVKEIDLSHPSAEEATALLNLYKYGSTALNILQGHERVVNYILGEEAVLFITAFVQRLELIHQELENVANGTATEEDWDELMWQNTFATKPQGLAKIHAQALQDIEAGLVEEGGWDAV